MLLGSQASTSEGIPLFKVQMVHGFGYIKGEATILIAGAMQHSFADAGDHARNRRPTVANAHKK